jgi:hypothetical protein
VNLPALPWWAWAAGGVAAALLVYRAAGGTPRAAGEAIGSAAVEVAGGVTAGVAYGIGDAIGVPRTDETECERAIREGRTWDASFACPAGTFIGSLWSRARSIVTD